MARPIAEGLMYFPMDVDLFDDPKLLMVEEEHGIQGGYIALRLLCWIYRQGYYTNWNNEMSYIFAKRIGNAVTGALVTAVVHTLVKRGFFDERMYTEFAILTSKGIQKRWQKIIRDAKRKAVINPLHNLVEDLDSDETAFLPEETMAATPLMPQSKVEEKKEEENKEYPYGGAASVNTKTTAATAAMPPPAAAWPPSVSPTLEAVQQFFAAAGANREMANKFWNKWEGLGWVQGYTPIRNWTGFANNFIANYHFNETKYAASGKKNKSTQQPAGVITPGVRKFGQL
ncbi:DUF4373 domain-containing protein [Chitinophaga varians]|uniref:DUF4373 domain-containing protein n=1 Tax=Chitinophaga varians TaxID=2202339 RepID=UPI00165EDA84|nr:DUF4373 domain-containing protein [Chitinophaga varians]MBC9915028.1 DUF4373 domain-containing protein [Chitinophaga varians]